MATNTPGKAAIALAAAAGVYAVLLGALMTPPLQRFALYANSFNTLFYHDINDAEQFGFCKNQVTPFQLSTPDGEVLYAWHVLPIDAYVERESTLKREDRPSVIPYQDFRNSSASQLMKSDPKRKVVISCRSVSWNRKDFVLTLLVEEVHGNAGHIAQGWRTDTFRYLSTLPNTHVFTIDYRGFGHSTGYPTEAGLIQDGVALINFVLNDLGVPPEDIVILGQSLGTAVASAVALEFADPNNTLNPGRPASADEQQLLSQGGLGISRPTLFGGAVLVAPFSNLPSLMLTYRIGGIFPLLIPLRPFPAIGGMLTSQMVDKWHTADRLKAYYEAASTILKKGPHESGASTGSLQIIHALNDQDISYHQTEMICQKMFDKHDKCIDGGDGPMVSEVRRGGLPFVRFEILGHGGHNRVVTYSPVTAAVRRAFRGGNAVRIASSSEL